MKSSRCGCLPTKNLVVCRTFYIAVTSPSEEAKEPQIQPELLESMGLEYFFQLVLLGFLTCLHITSQFCLLQWVFNLLGEGYGGILGKLCNWILCYWGCILSCDCFNEVKNSFMYSLLASSISNSKAQWSGFTSIGNRGLIQGKLIEININVKTVKTFVYRV